MNRKRTAAEEFVAANAEDDDNPVAGKAWEEDIERQAAEHRRKRQEQEQKHQEEKSDTGSKTKDKKRRAILVRADSLEPESISWSWRNRFAFRKMGVIAGDPGLGKSTILIDIAARHTTDAGFPMGEGKATPCDVLFLTAEDGLRDTLVPRLIAAEADLSRVHFLTGTKIEGAADAMFDIVKDIEALREVFADNPAIRVLIIDPLTAYLGSGTKAKENSEVRRVLAPLIKLIEDFDVLLLVNNHLNKSAGKALYRILDSIAFTALGRIIHLVAEDVENRDLKKFICSKTNIGSLPRGLTYIIQKHWITSKDGEEIETTRISWGTQYIDETADEALAPVDSGDATQTDDAVELLKLIFADTNGGPVKVSDIEAEAVAARYHDPGKDFSQNKPFRNARERLGVVISRKGFGPGAVVYWSLPAAADHSCPTPASPSYSKVKAGMEDEGRYGDDTDHTCPQTPYLPSSVSKSKGQDLGRSDDGQRPQAPPNRLNTKQDDPAASCASCADLPISHHTAVRRRRLLADH